MYSKGNINMRYIALLMLAGVVCGETRADLAAPGASANSSAPSLVAIVNIQEVIKNSEAFKEIQKNIEKAHSKSETQLRMAQEQIEKEGKQLGSLQGTLSKNEFEKKQAQLAIKVENLQKTMMDQRREIESAYSAAVLEFQDKVQKILESLAPKSKFSVVLDRQFILWADPKSPDLTQDVLNELNKQFQDNKKK
jgi:Skp family chaperone for outer membrane proteins